MFFPISPIEPSEEHRPVLVSFMEELQDHLVDMDPLDLLQRTPEYGEAYVSELLRNVKEHEGKIFLAMLDNTAVGMIAGIIKKPTEVDRLEMVPKKIGYILELIVSPRYRGKYIGSQLMGCIENYFCEQKCDFSTVSVFAPNSGAQKVYRQLGYSEREIELIKPLK